eukprot:1152912-Pelagomonas_calceolata.AAC.3
MPPPCTSPAADPAGHIAPTTLRPQPCLPPAPPSPSLPLHNPGTITPGNTTIPGAMDYMHQSHTNPAAAAAAAEASHSPPHFHAPLHASLDHRLVRQVWSMTAPNAKALDAAVAALPLPPCMERLHVACGVLAAVHKFVLSKHVLPTWPMLHGALPASQQHGALQVCVCVSKHVLPMRPLLRGALPVSLQQGALQVCVWSLLLDFYAFPRTHPQSCQSCSCRQV